MRSNFRAPLRALALLVPLALIGTGLSAAEKVPSGTVDISSTTFALGIGGSWGDGILTMKDGSKHPFSVKGFDFGAVGLAKLTATGQVYNLARLEDFEGNYAAVSAEATLGGGVGGTTMQNQHGVVINLSSTQQGMHLTLGAKGIEVKLER